ncbi:hypothetical protein [Psychroserpens sp.]|jgi:hypothetical protein|uniref:hypothetical protein n=1 Tax=Psychroserpens sp. TaxID=2020870 RepID=UPI0039E72084
MQLKIYFKLREWMARVCKKLQIKLKLTKPCFIIIIIIIIIIGNEYSAGKEIGTLEQLNATAIKKSQFVIGKLFRFGLLEWVY